MECDAVFMEKWEDLTDGGQSGFLHGMSHMHRMMMKLDRYGMTIIKKMCLMQREFVW